MLKRPELLVFISFLTLSRYQAKNLHNHRIPLYSAPQFDFSIHLHFSIFTHLLVFPPRHWPRSFFYQPSRSFGFPLPVSQRVGGFLSIDPSVFLHHLPLGFLEVFYLCYTYNYAHHLPTYSLELAS